VKGGIVCHFGNLSQIDAYRMDRHATFFGHGLVCTDYSRRDQSNRVFDRRSSQQIDPSDSSVANSTILGDSSQSATTGIIGFGQVPKSKVEIPS
jgi:hypothetical protein